jgi:hypothetical protein
VLCCGAEIGMLIFGIITLVKGNFALSGSRVVQGVPARVIGVLLLVPLIAGQGGEAIMGMMWGIDKGLQGQPVNIQDAMKDLQSKALIINAIATGVPLLAVLVIALSTAGPPTKRRRARTDLDDADDDEQNDDRPRRRSPRADDDDDDDRPRRRRARPDESDDEPAG